MTRCGVQDTSIPSALNVIRQATQSGQVGSPPAAAGTAEVCSGGGVSDGDEDEEDMPVLVPDSCKVPAGGLDGQQRSREGTCSGKGKVGDGDGATPKAAKTPHDKRAVSSSTNRSANASAWHKDAFREAGEHLPAHKLPPAVRDVLLYALMENLEVYCCSTSTYCRKEVSTAAPHHNGMHAVHHESMTACYSPRVHDGMLCWLPWLLLSPLLTTSLTSSIHRLIIQSQ